MITWLLLATCALGLALLLRVPVCPRSTGPSAPLKISIVIPARNEVSNIRVLLESITALTHKPHEVIVVDDGSTDGTAQVALDAGARVVSAPPLPDGWRGKAWACWHGAAVADGDMLLFLDADTIFKSDAMERIAAAWSTRKCKALSLGPYHEVKRPYEELSAIFNLLTFMGMGAFSLFGSPDRTSRLFGPFLLIDRKLYHEIGGHQAVRGQILEHMSMGAILRKRGEAMCCLGGRGVVHTRMYPDGLGSLVEGWSKAFADGAAKTSPLILWLSVVWITGAMSAFIHLILSPWTGADPRIAAVIYLAFAAVMFLNLRRVGRFAIWSSLCYPILLIAFFAIFGRSLHLRHSGKSVRWKARIIEPAARERQEHDL